MSSELVFVRKEVLPKLLKHPLALPFKYPVDAITEGIYPDYFLVSYPTSPPLPWSYCGAFLPALFKIDNLKKMPYNHFES